VLASAGVLAVALIPLAFAYLQLGYHPDVDVSGDAGRPVHDGVRVLERVVADAAWDATGSPWAQRESVVADVRSSLRPRFETLEASRVRSGVAYEVAYNQTRARAWATTACPSGPNRRFGPCLARDGIVVQERAGETTVIAVAVDVTVTSKAGGSTVTVVL
jgi:hypothetical protein